MLTSVVAKHHYIPAAYIGRFSSQAQGPTRERLITVFNLKSDSIRTVKASNIGARKNIYNLTDGDIDNWDAYETGIPRVLDQICQGDEISLDDWVHIAVPFVTGLFVRGREFNERYESRPDIADLMGKMALSSDNTNLGRTFEMSRLLAPVMAARWTVLHGYSHPNLVSNDRGLAATQDSSTGDVGWVIPLDKDTALGLFPQKQRLIASWTDGSWIAELDHRNLSTSDSFEDLNRKLAACCSEFFYGSSEFLVKPLHAHAAKTIDPVWLMEASWRQISSQQRIAHERDWYTLSTIAAEDVTPSDIPDFNPSKHFGANNRWSPQYYLLPTNLSCFPSGVSVSGSKLNLTLELLDDFDDHILHAPQQVALADVTDGGDSSSDQSPSD